MPDHPSGTGTFLLPGRVPRRERRRPPSWSATGAGRAAPRAYTAMLTVSSTPVARSCVEGRPPPPSRRDATAAALADLISRVKNHKDPVPHC